MKTKTISTKIHEMILFQSVDVTSSYGSKLLVDSVLNQDQLTIEDIMPNALFVVKWSMQVRYAVCSIQSVPRVCPIACVVTFIASIPAYNRD